METVTTLFHRDTYWTEEFAEVLCDGNAYYIRKSVWHGPSKRVEVEKIMQIPPDYMNAGRINELIEMCIREFPDLTAENFLSNKTFMDMLK